MKIMKPVGEARYAYNRGCVDRIDRPKAKNPYSISKNGWLAYWWDAGWKEQDKNEKESGNNQLKG